MEARKHMMLQNMVFLILLTFSSLFFLNSSAEDKLQTYIVHLSSPPDSQVDGIQSWYNSFLPTSDPNNEDEEPRMVYSYRNVLRGFAAKLTADEVKAMEKKEGFVFARPERVFSLQTTHSPDFLGLHQNLGAWQGSKYGKGLIIGLLDTGITPFHPSFNDEGMPPPPAKWKGKCEFTDKGACNKKLIGARNFVTGSTGPPVDEEGHGTHTASTAAGYYVRGANVFGNANGTAVGIAPLAHVAMYKVCGKTGCEESSILAALDAAIEDGVDVISISLDAHSVPFFEDTLAIGSFTSMQRGIFVSLAAGNSGPFNATLSNEAPWMLTVGASTIDRKIKATVSLGNKELFQGETRFQPKDFPGKLLSLVFLGTNGDQDTAWCAEGSLDAIDVKGKIVICKIGGIARIAKGHTVKDAGGAAMILVNDKTNEASTSVDAHVLPAIRVGFNAREAIEAYLNSTASLVASIQFHGTVIGDVSAPQVTSFSSKVPSLASPGILKPDIIGPGVSILTA